MNFHKVLVFGFLGLTLTACGGGSGAGDLIGEIEALKTQAETAALALTEDSILGYYTDYSGERYTKVERSRVTIVDSDFCGDGSNKKKQISFRIKPITNETKGWITLNQGLTIDFSICKETEDSEETHSVQGRVIKYAAGSTFVEYDLESLDGGYIDGLGYKIFDLQ